MPFSWKLWLGVFFSLIVGALSLIGVEHVYQRTGTGNAESEAIVMVNSMKSVNTIIIKQRSSSIKCVSRRHQSMLPNSCSKRWPSICSSLRAWCLYIQIFIWLVVEIIFSLSNMLCAFKIIHARTIVDSILFPFLCVYPFGEIDCPVCYNRSKPVAERIILCCVLLIALMIGNAYSGGLASIMTVPQWVNWRTKNIKKVILNCQTLWSPLTRWLNFMCICIKKSNVHHHNLSLHHLL